MSQKSISASRHFPFACHMSCCMSQRNCCWGPRMLPGRHILFHLKRWVVANVCKSYVWNVPAKGIGMQFISKWLHGWLPNLTAPADEQFCLGGNWWHTILYNVYQCTIQDDNMYICIHIHIELYWCQVCTNMYCPVSKSLDIYKYSWPRGLGPIQALAGNWKCFMAYSRNWIGSLAEICRVEWTKHDKYIRIRLDKYVNICISIYIVHIEYK